MALPPRTLDERSRELRQRSQALLAKAQRLRAKSQRLLGQGEITPTLWRERESVRNPPPRAVAQP
jgi:hypothetical protein